MVARRELGAWTDLQYNRIYNKYVFLYAPSEVSNLDIATNIQQKIFRLDISEDVIY